MDAAWIAASFLISAAGTAAAIGYARARRMIDLPGQRRSHSVPTPRGGGVGIVLAAVFVLCFAFPARQKEQTALLVAGLLLVAGIGWWDDHRPLGARVRIVVHGLAALLVAWPFFVFAFVGDDSWRLTVVDWRQSLVLVTIGTALLVGIVWSINLHNFIDGINGLLAVQSVWFFAGIGVLDLTMGQKLGWMPFGLAAACLAFVPFNFPTARVFMGDVGSGALGFLVAVSIPLVAFSGREEPRLLAIGLILASAPAIDATATLLARMLGGRRWYSAHREHLYQWLVRSGRSHARVVGYYMAWNLLIAAPASLIVASSPRLDVAFAAVAAVYVLGFVVWLRSRRAILSGARRRA